MQQRALERLGSRTSRCRGARRTIAVGGWVLCTSCREGKAAPGTTEQRSRAELVGRATVSPEPGNIVVLAAGDELRSAIVDIGLPLLPAIEFADEGRYWNKDRDFLLIKGGEPDGTPASVFPASVPEEEWTAPIWQARIPTSEEGDATVRLVYPGSAREQRVCSAVAVTDEWLLTAAHCVAPRPTSMLLGKRVSNADSVALSTARDDCRVPSWFTGGDFDPGGVACAEVKQNLLRQPIAADDLALVRSSTPLRSSVRRPFATTGAGSPPLISSGGQPGGLLADGVRCIGYGATTIAEEGGDCRSARAFAIDRQSGDFVVASAVGGELRLEGEPRIASGDSGGPALARFTSPWQAEVVVGVVVESDCHGKQIAASILRDEVREWIEAVTGVVAMPPKG
jgi:Trypsin